MEKRPDNYWVKSRDFDHSETWTPGRHDATLADVVGWLDPQTATGLQFFRGGLSESHFSPPPSWAGVWLRKTTFSWKNNNQRKKETCSKLILHPPLGVSEYLLDNMKECLGRYNYQNKKGQQIFQLHRFLNNFLQLAAEKKYSKTVQLEIISVLLILWRLD